MAAESRQGELLAGGVAAAALPLLVYVLGVPPLPAVLLAGALYGGLVLLRPWTGWLRGEVDDLASRDQFAYQTAFANAAAIRALESHIAKPAVRAHVGRIDDQIDRVLAVMREDGNLAAASLFNDRLLEPYRELLTKYELLWSRRVQSAAGGLERIETHDLPLIEKRVGDFYEELHRTHLVDLAALSDILEFNLESIVVPRPRRHRHER